MLNQQINVSRKLNNSLNVENFTEMLITTVVKLAWYDGNLDYR